MPCFYDVLKFERTCWNMGPQVKWDFTELSKTFSYDQAKDPRQLW